MGPVSRELPLSGDGAGHGAGVIVKLYDLDADGRVETIARVDEQGDRLRR